MVTVPVPDLPDIIMGCLWTGVLEVGLGSYLGGGGRWREGVTPARIIILRKRRASGDCWCVPGAGCQEGN